MTKKILIIEDDVTLLYGLQAKFRVEGFDVSIDQGSEKIQILDKIKALKPNYIILDILLPEINGLDILAGIKANQEISATPVFVFTSLSDSDSRQQANKLGADFYLVKTDFNLDEFVDKFKKIINNLERPGVGGK